MALVERFVAEKSAWITQKQNDMRLRAVKTPPELGEGMASPAVRPYAEAKEEALRFVQERVQAMNAQYGFSFARISVRNQKTRWGSCSRRGNLNFTYRILYLPPHLADYIVVHELCHLAEMNHGPKFWNLVARVCPEYQAMRRELRMYQGNC